MAADSTNKMLQAAQDHNPSDPVAFSLGWSLPANAESLQQQLEMAGNAVAALRGKIQNEVIGTVAEGAAVADLLKQKIASQIQGDLGDAAGTAVQMQQPINVQLAGQLGTAMENAAGLGVPMPEPGTDQQQPQCVQIRLAAQTGSLDPAIAAWRANALPIKDTDPLGYAQWVDRIAMCLPSDQGIQSAFFAALSRIINQPPSPPAALQQPSPSSGSVVITGGPPTVAPAGGAGLPMQAGGSPLVGPPQIIPPKPSPPPPGIIPIPPIPAPQPGGGGGGGPGPGPHVQTGAPWGDAFPPRGWFTGQSCDTIAALTQQGNFYYTNGSRTQVGAAFMSGQQCVIGIENIPFFGGSYSYDEIVSNDCCNPTPPVPPTPPTGGPPPGNCPPPPPPKFACPPTAVTCPTPQINITNEIKCPPPSPSPPPRSPRKYCAYCDTNGVPYIIFEGDPPKNSGDKQFQCATSPLEIDFSKCCGTGTKPPPPPIYITPPGPDVEPSPPPFTTVTGCGGIVSAPLLTQDWFPVTLTELFRQLSEANFLKGTTGIAALDLAIGYLQPLLAGVIGTSVDGLLQFAKQIGQTADCQTANQAAVITSRILLGFLSRWVSSAFDHSDQRLEYIQSTNCSWKLPSAPEATAAYLANAIDFERLQCLVKANGYDWLNWAPVAESARPKLAALQYGVLHMRELLDDKTYQLRLRQLGFIQDHDLPDIDNLLKQIPPTSDIVRMMVRDAGDDALAVKFNLDAQFDQKWSGQLQKWTQWQGVDPTYMKYLWRAHWSIPAPVQLATMLQRLSRLNPGDPAYVDLDIVRTALQQQDIAPFWVDKFIAINYRPLTRIDARRAYEIGALPESGLKEAYLNLGYNDDNANTLVQFNKKNVQRTLLRNPAVKQLAAGEITNGDFDQIIRDAGADSDTAQKGIVKAQQIADSNRRKKCVAAARKRFFSGDYDASQALAQLQNLGIDPSFANLIVAGWQCEVDARGKDLNAITVNQLYEAGLIDEGNYVKRLRTLGISQDDAVLLLRLIQRKLNIKATKAQADAIRKEQSAADRLARTLARQARQQQRQTQTQNNGIAKMQAAKVIRGRRLIEAGEKFSTHSGLSLADAIQFVQATYNSALSNALVTNDEAIVAIVTIAGDKQITTQAQFTDALGVALAAVEQTQ